MQKMVPLTFPVTLAGDFAGEISEVGQGVSGLTVGEQVFGFAPVIAGGSGATGEYVAASASMVSRKPAGANYSEAAALPLAGVSAVQALEDHMKVKSGERVLVHGGAGGIGSFAVQCAKHLGCHVATTVRGSQMGFVRSLGADEVVDFELERFDEKLKGYDAVLDTVGGEVYRKSFSVLKKGGVVASMIQNPLDQELASKFGTRTVFVTTHVDSASLRRMVELVDRGALKSRLSREYPIEQTREAYEYLEQDHPKGKVVVKIR
jgi:NADPH:quinone reductase-like Zn-dependent oxidoreductase